VISSRQNDHEIQVYPMRGKWFRHALQIFLPRTVLPNMSIIYPTVLKTM
jgi:hypothetical protein